MNPSAKAPQGSAGILPARISALTARLLMPLLTLAAASGGCCFTSECAAQPAPTGAVTLRENYLVTARVFRTGAEQRLGELSLVTGTPEFRAEAASDEGRQLWMELSGKLRPSGSGIIVVGYHLRISPDGKAPKLGQAVPSAQSLMKMQLGEECTVLQAGGMTCLLSIHVCRRAEQPASHEGCAKKGV